MLTLQEVKSLIKPLEIDGNMPTAKYLAYRGTVLVEKRIGNSTRLTVYQEGYAVYQVGKYRTVFSVLSCGDYLYESSAGRFPIQGKYFDSQAWHVRLLLEGEDRLSHNQEMYEREKHISYSAVSEEWVVLGDAEEALLERLIREEAVDGFLKLITERQRFILCQLYFQRKSQQELSEELGITPAAVRRIREEAIRRIQKKRGIARNLSGYVRGAATYAG